MSDPEALYRALMEEIVAEFPRFRLVRKEGDLLQRSIDAALRVITFGSQSGYLDRYVTTLGDRVYVPTGWDERDPRDRYATMRHERVHLRQFRRWGLPLMAVLYLLLPLPVGVAWFRMRFERVAYEESIRATAETRGRAAVESPEYRDNVISQFTGGAYAWMWPFRKQLGRWYDRFVEGLPE